MEKGRLYVKDTPTDATVADFTALFGRLCPVLDVYIPGPTPTGIRRNFVIVTLEADESNLKNYMKTFNGILWMGVKIRIELAKEWYQTRWDKEKKEFEEKERKKEEELQQLNEIVDYCIPKANLDEALSIRKSKFLPVKQISAVPTVIGPLENHKIIPTKGKSVIPCGSKVIFDTKLYQEKYQDHLLSVAKLASEGKISQISDSENESEDDRKINKVQKNSMLKPKTQELKQLGGGARKGFGSLIVESKDKNENLKEGYNCSETVKGYLEEQSDEEKCLLPEDLEEETLLKEKNRALNIFDSLFGDNAVNNEVEKDNVRKVGYNRIDEIIVQQDNNTFANLGALKNIFADEQDPSNKPDESTIQDTLESKLENVLLQPKDVSMSFNFFNSGQDTELSEIKEPENQKFTKEIKSLNDQATKPSISNAKNEDIKITSISQFCERLRPMRTIEEILAAAKKFHRKKSIEEVEREWREGRDKLVLDYKRKRKDANRRKNSHPFKKVAI